MLKSGRQLPDPNRPGHWATGLDAQRLADAQRQGPASAIAAARPERWWCSGTRRGLQKDLRLTTHTEDRSFFTTLSDLRPLRGENGPARMCDVLPIELHGWDRGRRLPNSRKPSRRPPRMVIGRLRLRSQLTAGNSASIREGIHDLGEHLTFQLLIAR